MICTLHVVQVIRLGSLPHGVEPGITLKLGGGGVYDIYIHQQKT